MKTCFKCNKSLPIDMFYPHPRMSDGRLGKCKECAKSDSAARYKEKMRDFTWAEMERERNREKSTKYRQAGVYPSKEATIAAKSRWSDRNSQKVGAHRKASRAIKVGKLVKKPCEVCGSPIAEAHHDDYEKPLQVRWLCPKHHAEHHVLMRRLEKITNMEAVA